MPVDREELKARLRLHATKIRTQAANEESRAQLLYTQVLDSIGKDRLHANKYDDLAATIDALDEKAVVGIAVMGLSMLHHGW